ncbi:Nicotinamide-nucleotide amidohydrolase PncC [Thiorhodovibrio winogradskyi]|uniref:Nicotinamide-nucleotide amidohydrolase PncC n=1 Tax=Thiorhodovibrio winogradskyi TaxID=77007 RepID=A0ABZ0S6Q6_9GAMM|nr:CinA family protein [Thiorhodovibrio winogradskyi]
MVTDAQLQQLAISIGERLRARNWRLVTAESLTGGWIAKICTDIPGSSTWFDRAFVTYSPEAKQQMLGLSSELLERAGIVSEAVAAAMASAALTRGQADIALAVTGVAGPGGGSSATPVGTLCSAWTDINRQAQQQPPWVETCHFQGDRDQVRRQTVHHGLARLRDILA